MGDPVDTKRLRELAEAATPGPWGTEQGDLEEWPSTVAIAVTGGRQKIYACPPGGTFPKADQEFIAAANPSTVLALLDEIERLRRDNASWANSDFERQLTAANAEIKQLREVNASLLGAEVDGASTEIGHLHGRIADLEAELAHEKKRVAAVLDDASIKRCDAQRQLAAVSTARDEACDIASSRLYSGGRLRDDEAPTLQRIAELRLVGRGDK